MFDNRKLRNLITIACLIALHHWSQAVWADVVVVAHRSHVDTTMSKADCSRIFLGRSNAFPDGSKAVPVNQAADSSTRVAFDKAHLGKSASQIKAYWSRQLFTGRGVPPQEVRQDSDVIEFIVSNKDAIGYVDSSAVNDSVRVVKVVD